MVHNTYKDRYAFRDGDWVLIDAAIGTERPVPAAWLKKHHTPTDDDLPVELYNLKTDPGQRHNLAAASADQAPRPKKLGICFHGIRSGCT
jgi:arylsulfatase A